MKISLQIKKKISEIYEQFSGFSLEMRDRGGAIICGVRGVICSRDEAVQLALLNGEELFICGKELSCVSYAGGTVSVCGRIQAVSFTGYAHE